MEYEFTVKFRRNLSDDEPVARKNFPGKPLREALLQQLRQELQAAYDDTNIAGTFEIKRASYRRISERHIMTEPGMQEVEAIIKECGWSKISLATRVWAAEKARDALAAQLSARSSAAPKTDTSELVSTLLTAAGACYAAGFPHAAGDACKEAAATIPALEGLLAAANNALGHQASLLTDLHDRMVVAAQDSLNENIGVMPNYHAMRAALRAALDAAPSRATRCRSLPDCGAVGVGEEPKP